MTWALESNDAHGNAVSVPPNGNSPIATRSCRMQSEVNRHAGFAAVTLVESLLLHLQETGHLEAGDRELIYDIAIGAHLSAELDQPSDAHLSVVKLLKTLQTRADGVSIVGNLPRDD